MAGLNLKGDTSGSIEIISPDVAGSTVLTCPTGVGTIMIESTDGLKVSDAIFHAGDTNTKIRFPANDTFTVETAGTEALRVTSNQRVGINTTNPFGAFHVHAGNDANFSFATASGEASLEILNNAGTLNVPVNVRASEYKIKVGSVERVNISTDGNVGIGTDNPVRLLEASTTNTTEYNTDFQQSYNILALRNKTDNRSVGLEFKIGTNGQAAIGAVEVSDTNTDLVFGTRSSSTRSEKARITSAGNLGIGTNSPSQSLHIQKDSSHQILLKRGGAAPSECTFQNDGNLLKITNNVNGIEFQVGSGSLETAMYIEDGGNVAISTANPDKTLTVDGTARLNVADLGNVSGNLTLNFNTNNNYVMTLTGTTAFLAPTGIATGQSGVIVLKQDGTGSRTATWDSSFKFKGGTAPTLSTGAGKSDAVAYFCHEPPYIIAGTFIGIGSA